MKRQNLLASVAAVLITSATLSGISKDYTADFQPSAINGAKVTNLAPITVHPNADERRAASLLTVARYSGNGSSTAMAQVGMGGEAGQFSLIGSQLAMPYYSFGNKFGRISKE